MGAVYMTRTHILTYNKKEYLAIIMFKFNLILILIFIQF
jgi:hypothetical protein